jgi:hemerythrin
MNNPAWNDNLSVGVKLFDEHHKRLFELLGKACATCTNRSLPDDSKSIIDELVDYARYHFDAEERLMELHGYEESPAHQSEHAHFSQTVRSFEGISAAGSKVYSYELISFLCNWLMYHIMEADKRYGLYLNSVGVD